MKAVIKYKDGRPDLVVESEGKLYPVIPNYDLNRLIIRADHSGRRINLAEVDLREVKERYFTKS